MISIKHFHLVIRNTFTLEGKYLMDGWRPPSTEYKRMRLIIGLLNYAVLNSRFFNV
jgi:hypothetical protein